MMGGADDNVRFWPFVSVNFNINVPYRNVGFSPAISTGERNT